MAGFLGYSSHVFRSWHHGTHTQVPNRRDDHASIDEFEQENSVPGNEDEKSFATKTISVREQHHDNQAPSCMLDDYSQLERKIDSLKQEVARMRAEESLGRQSPLAQQYQVQGKSASTRSKIPAPTNRSPESAAARLQREHEFQQMQLHMATASRQKASEAPSPNRNDFPELGGARTSQHSRVQTLGVYDDKPSYASIATAGTTSSACATNSGERHVDHDDHTSDTVIVSPRGEDAKASANIEAPSSQAKHSPGFAQPTKAFAHKAGTTVRRDTVNCKSPPIGSPTKSCRMLPPMQTKRGTLPGGWINSTDTSPISPTISAAAPTISATVDASSPNSAERWQVVDSGRPTDQPILRKKTSSYMSPTKATTIRNRATLGPVPLQRTSPRVKKPVSRLDTNVVLAHQSTELSSASTAKGSAISSATEEIITESAMPSSLICGPDETHGSLFQTDATCDPLSIQTNVQLPDEPEIPSCSSISPTAAMYMAAGAMPQDPTDATANDTVLARNVSTPTSTTSGPRKSSSDERRPRDTTSTLAIRRIEERMQEQAKQRPINAYFRPIANGPRRKHAIPIRSPRSPTLSCDSSNTMRPRRATIGGPLVVEELVAKAKAAGLPIPANTVAKRRVSHGHLLQPIKAKLDKYGLWSGQGSSRQRTQGTDKALDQPPTVAVQHLREVSFKIPTNPAPPAPITADFQAPARTKAIPPHLRHKPAEPEVASAIEDVGLQREAQRLQAPSLRATATEFKPMWKAETIEQELALLDWEGWFAFRTPAEWNSLHPGIRAAIQAIREYKCKGGQPPSGTFPGMSPTKIRSKTANQRFWAGLMQHQTSKDDSENTTSITPSDVVAVMQKSLSQDSTDSHVQDRQVLSPDIEPDNRNVQWSVQAPVSKAVPLSFGRAPAPAPVPATDALSTIGSPGTITISPTSDDTSPRRDLSNPGSAAKPWQSAIHRPGVSEWSIGTALHNTPGWTIGDGREIRYAGPGTGTGALNGFAFSQTGVRERRDQAPRMIGADENVSGFTSPPLAPRSRQQWAKLAQQAQRQPCGNMDITHAMEQIPFNNPFGETQPNLFGLCPPCSGSLH